MNWKIWCIVMIWAGFVFYCFVDTDAPFIIVLIAMSPAIILLTFAMLNDLLVQDAKILEEQAKKERALRTSVMGTCREEVLTKLRYFYPFEITFDPKPSKVRVIIRELTEHPEQHYEEIDFLVENQLSFVEMLDLIDRSELEDWHIARSQLYV